MAILRCDYSIQKASLLTSDVFRSVNKLWIVVILSFSEFGDGEQPSRTLPVGPGETS